MVTIGITTPVMRDVKDIPKISVNKAYAKYVQAAGAASVLIPSEFFDVTTWAKEEKDKYVDQIIDSMDAILLSGGHDIVPIYYGEEDRNCTQGLPKRDEFEIYLAKRCIERKKPILGICRGHQIIGVAHGCQLWQDIREFVDSPARHMQTQIRSVATHKIKIAQNSFLYKALQKDITWVNSMHHQAIDCTVPIRNKNNKIVWKESPSNFDINIIARSPSDNVIEAIESTKDGVLAIGVQWHPEEMFNDDCLKIIQAFIKEIK